MTCKSFSIFAIVSDVSINLAVISESAGTHAVETGCHNAFGEPRFALRQREAR